MLYDHERTEQATTLRRQALLREVNERIERLTDRWDVHDGPFAVLCECGDTGCVHRIDLSRDAYESVRAAPLRFVLKAGHEDGDDRVVARHDGYVIVEKMLL